MENNSFQESMQTATMEGGSFVDAQQQLQLDGDNNIVIVMQGDHSAAEMQAASSDAVSQATAQVGH